MVYIDGDSCSARKFFNLAIDKYDEIIIKNPNIYDAINRAFCFLFTEGEEGYRQQLKILELTYNHKDEIDRINFFYNLRLEDVISDMLNDFKYSTIEQKK